MEYYDGQIITNHTEFANWTNSHGNKLADRANGDGTYTVYNAIVEPTEAEINAQRVAELKQKLADSDYAVIKIAEATGEETEALREKYAQVIADRKAWREEINQLEN